MLQAYPLNMLVNEGFDLLRSGGSLFIKAMLEPKAIDMLALMEIDEYLWAIRLAAKPIQRENVALRTNHDDQVVTSDVLEGFVQFGIARRVFSKQNDIRPIEAITLAAKLVAEIVRLIRRAAPVTAVANVDDILVIAGCSHLSKLAVQVHDAWAPCPFV